MPALRKPAFLSPYGDAAEAARNRQTENLRIGILLPQETPSALRLVFLFVEQVRIQNATAFVFGTTSLDERLNGSGVFVCGRIASSEREAVLSQYGIDAIVLPYRSGFLWQLDVFRRSAPVPAAYFDAWPTSKERTEIDLAIDPRVCDRKAAALFAEWMLATNKRLTAGSEAGGEYVA